MDLSSCPPRSHSPLHEAAAVPVVDLVVVVGKTRCGCVHFLPPCGVWSTLVVDVGDKTRRQRSRSVVRCLPSLPTHDHKWIPLDPLLRRLRLFLFLPHSHHHTTFVSFFSSWWSWWSPPPPSVSLLPHHSCWNGRHHHLPPSLNAPWWWWWWSWRRRRGKKRYRVAQRVRRVGGEKTVESEVHQQE